VDLVEASGAVFPAAQSKTVQLTVHPLHNLLHLGISEAVHDSHSFLRLVFSEAVQETDHLIDTLQNIMIPRGFPRRMKNGRLSPTSDNVANMIGANLRNNYSVDMCGSLAQS